MTLPVSGQIALSQVAEEAGLPLSNIGLGDPERALLAGVTTRQVAMSDLHGKSAGHEIDAEAVINDPVLEKELP